MPRQRIDRTDLILSAMPGTQAQIAELIQVAHKIVSRAIADMMRARLCYAPYRVNSIDGRLMVKYYMAGPSPDPEPKPFNRDLLLSKSRAVELDPPRIDPTINLYREPLNSLFGYALPTSDANSESEQSG